MLLTNEKYQEICETEDSIPIFSKYWWLEATAGIKNCSVIAVIKNEKIEAFLPFYIKKNKYLISLAQPLLTQKLGPWFKTKRMRNASEIEKQNNLMFNLLNELPLHDRYNQNWDHSITNWLPFYWNDFSQNTKYTYIINDISNIEMVFTNFDRSKKKNIKRAKEKLKVINDLDKADFYNNHKYNLNQAGIKISYSREYFYSIFDAATRNNSGKIFAAIDQNGKIHSANFIIWDSNSAYNLISTIDKDFRNSGSTSLVIYEAIKYLSNKTKSFDFEGSMIRGVEYSFRRFGAIQTPYFNIQRNSTKKARIIFSAYNFCKSLIS